MPGAFIRGDVPVQRTRRPASTPPSLALSVPPLASVALRGQLGAHATPLVLPGGLARAAPRCAVTVSPVVDVRCIVARAPATLCRSDECEFRTKIVIRAYVKRALHTGPRSIPISLIANRAREPDTMADAS